MISRSEIQDTTQAVIERIEEFETEYRSYSESSIDYFGGKAEAMGVAKTIVKAALSELIKNNAEDRSQVIIAYLVLRENCRSRSQTCEGCPLYAPKDRYQPSGIPAIKCLATQGAEYNIPPASWPDPEGGGED